MHVVTNGRSGRCSGRLSTDINDFSSSFGNLGDIFFIKPGVIIDDFSNTLAINFRLESIWELGG